MSTNYFNSFRSNKISYNTNSFRNSSQSKNYQSTQLNDKRSRLRRLVQEKIMKKYNLKQSTDFLENEIDTFIGCDNLSDKDLKILDNRINNILKEKGMLTNTSLKGSRSQTKNYSNLNQEVKVEDKEDVNNPVINKLNNNLTEPTNEIQQNRIMSGASHLSEYFPSKDYNPGNKLRNDPEVPDEDLIKPKKKPHRFEFEHEDDMWNAFNNVNRRLFEQEKIDEKQKDNEIKRRTKEDLDNQIKQKLLRLDGERKKNNEYHSILVKHIDHLNDLEEQKQAKIRAKILKEKENRDKQMWDNNYRKKVEKVKLRKYENQLLNYISTEIQNEKDTAVKKKIEAIEQLKKTLEENEQNRIKKEKLRQEEIEDDMKTAEEYNRILEKQELDRYNYFKNIEMKSTDFMTKMTDTVLKDLKEKNAKAELRMNEFLKKKEEQAVLDEKNDMIRRNKEKKDMKKFLDSQVEEKKKLAQFEKDIDEEQARIIQKDYDLYEEYKKDASDKVSFL